MKKILLLLLIIALAYSCSEKREKFKELKLTSNYKELYAKKHLVATEMFRPAKMYLYNDKIIVFDDIQKKIFKVFDMKELNFLHAFGDIGDGPNEFVIVDKESVNICDFFEVMDRNKLFHFQITDSNVIQGKENDLIVTKYFPIHNLKKINTDFYLFDNNNYQNYTHEFRTFDLISKREDVFSKVPNWNKNLTNEPSYKMSTTYSKSVCYNNDRIAVFYYHYPIFKIYSKGLELLNQNIVEYPSSSLDKIDTERIFFTEPYATDKYIYVMWIDKSKKDVGRNFESFKPDLLVFDWDGCLVDHYLLDQPIITFAVSDETGKMYAVSFREEDINVIYEYDLPEINIQTQNKFHKINNQYYSLDMLNGYFFSNEKEKDNIYRSDKYTMNGNYFGQKTGKIYKELESIKIILYFEESKLVLEKDIWKLLNLDSTKVELDTFFIKDRKILHANYMIESVGYDGKLDTLYFNTYMFSLSGSVVDISICAKTPNVEKYNDDFKEMISTFTLL